MTPTAHEVEFLLRYRRLPRDVKQAIQVLVRARTNLANLPIFVGLEEVADLYRLSVKTVRRKCSEGSFSPLPAKKYPYLWRRDDILRDIHGPTTRLPRRAHGFAATKARLALVTTTPA